jgi:hypothetical protein
MSTEGINWVQSSCLASPGTANDPAVIVLLGGTGDVQTISLKAVTVALPNVLSP